MTYCMGLGQSYGGTIRPIAALYKAFSLSAINMALCILDYGFVPTVFTRGYVPNIYIDDSVSIIITRGCAMIILLSLMAMC